MQCASSHARHNARHVLLLRSNLQHPRMVKDTVEGHVGLYEILTVTLLLEPRRKQSNRLGSDRVVGPEVQLEAHWNHVAISLIRQEVTPQVDRSRSGWAATLMRQQVVEATGRHPTNVAVTTKDWERQKAGARRLLAWYTSRKHLKNCTMPSIRKVSWSHTYRESQ